jgi:hypothetical protein
MPPAFYRIVSIPLRRMTFNNASVAPEGCFAPRALAGQHRRRQNEPGRATWA